MDGHSNQLLDVKNVVKAFGGLKAINNVSLQVTKGEIRGLIGPNASGKTTLINVITGMYKVGRGSIYFSGNRIDGLQPSVLDKGEVISQGTMEEVADDPLVIDAYLGG